MFYTKTAKIISAILLFLGVMRVLMGILVATSENPKLLAARYLGNHTSGEAIDKGFLYIFIAISLGVAAEISINIKKIYENDKEEDSVNDK
jgi:hypothetical protein